jgi:hypothetical protein
LEPLQGFLGGDPFDLDPIEAAMLEARVQEPVDNPRLVAQQQ